MSRLEFSVLTSQSESPREFDTDDIFEAALFLVLLKTDLP